MIGDLLIGYWPIWLLVVCVVLAAWTLCRAATLGDHYQALALSDHEPPLPVLDLEPVSWDWPELERRNRGSVV